MSEDWVVKHEKQEYTAPLSDIARWIIEGRLNSWWKYNDATGKEWKFNEVVSLISQPVLLTTTPSVDGHRVKRYLGVESVEVVIGTGLFSEIGSAFMDSFGARSTGFERKLHDAKRFAFDKLRFSALKMQGNAVIGVDLDYTEFTGNRIGLIVNGTIVELDPPPATTTNTD